MKLISWNVNGLRACQNKGFEDSFWALDADVFCLQEVKAQPEQLSLELPGYTKLFYCAEKKGYSGTAVFTRTPPLSVDLGMGVEEFDHEGRLLRVEFEDFFLVNCYTPNSQDELRRLPFRMRWEGALRAHLCELDAQKPVILCGDLNVAHQQIDIKNHRANHFHAGFTDEERQKFTELLEAGFVDSFRHFYPDQQGAYSWWSYFGGARARNVGWRLDYFVVSEKLKSRMKDAAIHQHILGSDHCPVELTL